MAKRRDTQSHFYHQFNNNRQDWSIDRWCRRLGISRKKLESHPHIQDVATLLMFDQHQSWFNQEDERVWTHCWQRVYHWELPLSDYHKRRLIGIIQGIEYRRQAYQQRQIKRQHIQARLERKLAAA